MNTNFIFISIIALIVFSLDQGIFGKNLKSAYSNVFNVNNTVYLILLFILLYLLLAFSYFSINFCLDEEIENKLKAAASVNNSVHVHNPNINITAGMANALTNVGVGAAIGAGMSAGATIAKNSALPVVGKLGIIIASGLAAGVITTGTSAALRISNSRGGSIDSSAICSSNPRSSTDFPAKSAADNLDLENVMTLLNSHYILSIVILYLVFSLLMLYILDLAIKNNWEFSLLKKVVSVALYKHFISAISFSSKTNKAFLLITWVVLFICCLSSLFFSFFILKNIDIISAIINS